MGLGDAGSQFGPTRPEDTDKLVHELTPDSLWNQRDEAGSYLSGIVLDMHQEVANLQRQVADSVQGQLGDKLDDVSKQLGIDPDLLRSGDATAVTEWQLAASEPYSDFVSRWLQPDGQWVGDPQQLSQEYAQVLAQMEQMGSPLSAVASLNPPWERTDAPLGLRGYDSESLAGVAGGSAQAGNLDGAWQEMAPDGSIVYAKGLDPYWQQANLDGRQGDEVPGFQGTCGLTTVANMARMCGKSLSELDVVGFAIANDLCDADSSDPGENGGTTPEERVKLLAAAGIPSHMESGRNLGDLAEYIDENRCVNMSVNAGALYDNPAAYGDGGTNHSILLTGTILDAAGNVIAYRVCDSGLGVGAVSTFPADVMKRAWEDTGGNCIVTDVARTQGYPPTSPQGQLA